MSSAKYSNSMVDAGPRKATSSGPRCIWRLAKGLHHSYKLLDSAVRAAEPPVAAIGGPTLP